MLTYPSSPGANDDIAETLIAAAEHANRPAYLYTLVLEVLGLAASKGWDVVFEQGTSESVGVRVNHDTLHAYWSINFSPDITASWVGRHYIENAVAWATRELETSDLGLAEVIAHV